VKIYLQILPSVLSFFFKTRNALSMKKKGEKMLAARMVERVYLDQRKKCLVEIWDLSRANMDAQTRHEALAKILGEDNQASLLLENLIFTAETKLPREVLKFIRFGGDMSVRDSLRHQPNLPYLASLSYSEREQEITRHKEMVATYHLTIPLFMYRDLRLVESGVSFYTPLSFEEQPSSWDPEETGIDIHFIFKGIANRSWEVFQKLEGLGIPREEAETVLAANLMTEVWLQGNYEALHNLLGARSFRHSSTVALVGQMYQLVHNHQPSFARVKDPSLLGSYS